MTDLQFTPNGTYNGYTQWDATNGVDTYSIVWNLEGYWEMLGWTPGDLRSYTSPNVVPLEGWRLYNTITTGIFDVVEGDCIVPTLTPTPTITPTPTSFICGNEDSLVDAIITENGEYIIFGQCEYFMFVDNEPNPTPTPTPTPTATPAPINDFDYLIIPNNDLGDSLIPNNDLNINLIPNNDINISLIPDNDLETGILVGFTFRFIPNNDFNDNQIPNDGLGSEIIPNNDLQPEIIEVVSGGCFTLITQPYFYPEAGYIIFPQFSNPESSEGTLKPNTFANNGVDFNFIDIDGNNLFDYYIQLLSNNYLIYFSQNGNTVIYEGDPFSFSNEFGGLINAGEGMETPTSQLILIQPSPVDFVEGEPVCIWYEILLNPTPTPTITETPTPTPTPIIPNRILYWNFSDNSSYSGTTTIYDLEGNSNGSLISSPLSGDTGCGTYINFDGVNQYIHTKDDLQGLFSGVSPNKSNITSIFMWVYPTGNGVILSEIGAADSFSGWHDSQIEMVSGTLKFGMWNGLGITSITSSISTPLNNWYYIGMIYDGTNLTAYVNGVNAGVVTFERVAPYNVGNGLYYTIAHSDITNMGDGSFGNFRVGSLEIYNTILASGQIVDNYNSQSINYNCVTPTPTITETPTQTPTPTITPSNTPNLDGFNYPSFSSISGLELVGTYVTQTANEIYLTSPTVSSVGNLYRSTSVRYDRDFSLEWKSYIGGGTGADGYCIQWTTTNNSNGSTGGGIGRIADSSTIHAIGFYTYTNNDFRWWKNNVQQSVDTVSTDYWRQVLYFWADYNHTNQTFDLYFSDVDSKPISPNKQYTSFSFDSTPYYIGFGAATGASQDYHNIVDWRLTFV